MKKYIIPMLILCFSFPAFSQFVDGSTPNQSQLVNDTVSIEDAKLLADDQYVSLVGNITARDIYNDRHHSEHYVFQDETGTITAEIDNELFLYLSQKVTPEMTIRIVGEIDRDNHHNHHRTPDGREIDLVEIDVDFMEIVQ